MASCVSEQTRSNSVHLQRITKNTVSTLRVKPLIRMTRLSSILAKPVAAVLCLLFLTVNTAEGFGLLGGSKKVAKAPSAAAEKAIGIYDKNFPFDRVQQPRSKLTDVYVKWGVPQRDIDGTPVFSSSKPKRRPTDISRTEAISTFNELSKVYGEDRAVKMVEIFPLCLAFDKNEFKESYNAWADIFGGEETKDMVLRNPGLLAVKRYQASTANDQTMVFSYIVAYTRPIGKAGPIGLLLLLSVPFIEAVTGLEIRSTFFSALGLS